MTDMNNLDHIITPTRHNPLAHGGEYVAEVAKSLDEINPVFGDHTSHIGDAYTLTQERPAKVANARTYYLTFAASTNGIMDLVPVQIASYQPMRKRIILSSGAGKNIIYGFSANVFSNIPLDASSMPTQGNFFVNAMYAPFETTYVGEIWAAIVGSGSTFVSVLEEIYA